MASVADMIKNGRKQAEQPATPPATPVVEQPVAQPQQQAEPQKKVEFTPAPPVISEADKAKQVEAMRVEQNEAIAPKKGYDYVFSKLKAENAVNAAEKNEELRKRQQRRENRGKLFRTLGDGIAAMSNLYFATQGAPSVQYDPKGSLSARAVERWDKMEALRREEEQKQYVRAKAARDEELRRQREERLQKDAEADAAYRDAVLANRLTIKELEQEGLWKRLLEQFVQERALQDSKNQTTLATNAASNKTKENVAQTNAEAKVKAAEISGKNKTMKNFEPKNGKKTSSKRGINNYVK